MVTYDFFSFQRCKKLVRNGKKTWINFGRGSSKFQFNTIFVTWIQVLLWTLGIFDHIELQD